MRTSHVLVSSFVLPLLAIGCAVTPETTTAQVELDESIARSPASALSAAVSGATVGDGVTIADAITKIGDTASALVPQGRSGAGHSRPRVAATTCTCDAAAKRCAFDGCTIAGATVTGTLTWGGGKIVCDALTVEVPAGPLGSASSRATLECALTYSETSLAGTVHTTGSAVASGTTYAWDATLTASGVTVASGAVTGGSLDVSASVEVTASSSGTKAYSASAVVALE